MSYWKTRIGAVVTILLSAFFIHYDWHLLNSEGKYYPKLAVFGPVGVIGGMYLLLFPSKAGKPQTTKDKVLAIVVLLIGVAFGVVNLFLLDPGFFGR